MKGQCMRTCAWFLVGVTALTLGLACSESADRKAAGAQAARDTVAPPQPQAGGDTAHLEPPVLCEDMRCAPGTRIELKPYGRGTEVSVIEEGRRRKGCTLNGKFHFADCRPTGLFLRETRKARVPVPSRPHELILWWVPQGRDPRALRRGSFGYSVSTRGDKVAIQLPAAKGEPAVHLEIIDTGWVVLQSLSLDSVASLIPGEGHFGVVLEGWSSDDRTLWVGFMRAPVVCAFVAIRFDKAAVRQVLYSGRCAGFPGVYSFNVNTATVAYLDELAQIVEDDPPLRANLCVCSLNSERVDTLLTGMNADRTALWWENDTTLAVDRLLVRDTLRLIVPHNNTHQ